MPNIKSAKKELRKTKTRTERNDKLTVILKRSIKRSRQAIAKNDPKAAETVKGTMKILDKAAQKGIIKVNNKDRNKSRLQSALNKATKKK